MTGENHLIATMVLANAMSLLGWAIFYQVARHRFGDEVASWALVFLIVHPGSLFYQFIYSESLFFLLVMVTWFGLERRRYGWVAFGVFLLPLTRAVGLFCVFPIAYHLVGQEPSSWMRRLRTDCGDRGARRETTSHRTQNLSKSNLQYYLFLILPLLAWGLYLGLMWNWTGNAFEGFAAQRYWRAHSVLSLVDLPKFLWGLFNPTDWHAFRSSLMDRCMFLVLLCTLPMICSLGKDLLVWTCVLGIVPAVSGTFISFTRYEATVFPMFIALAYLFKTEWWGWARNGALAAGVTLHVLLLWRFVNNEWAG
jgi:hypothetical protein